MFQDGWYLLVMPASLEIASRSPQSPEKSGRIKESAITPHDRIVGPHSLPSSPAPGTDAGPV